MVWVMDLLVLLAAKWLDLPGDPFLFRLIDKGSGLWNLCRLFQRLVLQVVRTIRSFHPADRKLGGSIQSPCAFPSRCLMPLPWRRLLLIAHFGSRRLVFPLQPLNTSLAITLQAGIRLHRSLHFVP